jgi:glycosyltransferase involved in cell wall biosynthesis
VIVSDWQGCPETIDQHTGVIVPAGDERALAKAIAQLADSPEQREKMSSAARARIERELTITHQVDNLVRMMGRVS